MNPPSPESFPKPETHKNPEPPSEYTDSLDRYMYEVGLEDNLLDENQELELAETIAFGKKAAHDLEELDEVSKNQIEKLNKDIEKGQNARIQFIHSNLRLVIAIASRFTREGILELQDLIQDGNIGLEKAVDGFDPSLGYRFSTYAVPKIRGEIIRAIDNTASQIRLPVDKARELSVEISRDDEGHEDLSAKATELLILTTPSSLEAKLSEETSSDFHEIIADITSDPLLEILHTYKAEQIEEALMNLTMRQSYAVKARFGFIDGREHTTQEIGEELNISRQAAGKLIERSIEILREQIDAELNNEVNE